MDREKTVFRLAKPMRKGLFRLLFSRFLLFAVLLIAQVLVVTMSYGWLSLYVPHLSVLLSVFTLAMVVYLFNIDMDSTGKLTWMLLIAVMPLPGAALLAFTRANLGHRRIKARVNELIERTRTALPQEEAVLRALYRDGSGTDDLVTYLNRSGCFPAFGRTEATYLPGGEATLAAMLEALRRAERYIFLESFIIEEGYMWGQVLQVLVEKAAAGVDVRVLYDGMCEVNKLPSDYCRRLAAQGIRAKAFAPIRPVVSSHYNYRDHRKILVIDGRVAFNGGVNLADEYINRVSPFGHWKDAAVMLRGDAVKSFTLLFLQMWNIDEKEPELAPYPFSDADEGAPPPCGGCVIPYGDSPLDREKVGETVYMDILNRANDYVHVMTPYLILDGELETALKYAARRGVDVSLILPGIPDKKLAWALAKSHYRSLLEAGVKLYEYTPGFVHAKVFVSDGCKAVVGTVNLDYRSLYHHFECATYLYRMPCIADVEADFQATLSRCRAVTPDTVRHEALGYRLQGVLLKFLAPLL